MGAKHVLKFSIYNYILFLVLLSIVFSFKKWRKVCLLVVLITGSYLIAMALIVFSGINVKLDIIKFVIPLLIFSLAIINGFSFKEHLKSKEYMAFAFAVLFGFFNGLGSSENFNLLIGRNESEFIPLIEVAFGVISSISIIILLLLLVNTLLQKFIKISKVNWILGFSIIVICISFPMIIKQIIY
nr:HupE/UreJ family protein [Lutibacter sp. Hel_I_33_5]